MSDNSMKLDIQAGHWSWWVNVHWNMRDKLNIRFNTRHLAKPDTQLKREIRYAVKYVIRERWTNKQQNVPVRFMDVEKLFWNIF